MGTIKKPGLTPSMHEQPVTRPHLQTKVTLDRVLTAAVLAGAILLAARMYQQQPDLPGQSLLSPPMAPIEVDQDASGTMGERSAAVTLVIYSDFACPYCGVFARSTWPQLKKAYVEPGLLFVEFVNFPLRLDQEAPKSTYAAECGRRQGRFWLMHDAIFEDQRNTSDEGLSELASRIGLQEHDFKQCLKSDMKIMLETRVARAQALGVGSTPTFFVGTRLPDGRLRITKTFAGALPVSEFDEAIAAALKGSDTPKAYLIVGLAVAAVAGLSLWIRSGVLGDDASGRRRLEPPWQA